MNERELLKKLGDSVPEPHVDVTGRVMREIRAMRDRPESGRPLWLAAIFSSGAAVAMVLFAAQSLTDFGDPFGGFLSSIWTVLR
jgi:anti-sigma factor RsiW